VCRFHACLLRTSLKDTRLCEYDKELLKNWVPPAGSKIATLTFGDLDGKELQFPEGSMQRPLKRVLCYQAKLAAREVKKQGWGPVPDIPDFWSEGEPKVDRIQEWIAASQAFYT
jgi:hypothetical protein